MKNFYKVIILGAGPIGLYLASELEKLNLDYAILESNDEVGGQLTRLYPEKEIVDIPGIESIKAKDYIALLYKKVNQDRIILNSKVMDIKKGENFEIYTGKSTYFCEKLIFATGLGATTPRPLGLENEDKCSNIIYSIKDFSHLKNKKVAIFGGGDSALDWAKEISAISNDVHLIHRRTEFRGNPETIKDCANLNVHMPYIPFKLNIDGNLATSIVIKKVDDDNKYMEIPVDFIFVNFGNSASFCKFPFPMINSFLAVDNDCKIENNVFAIGDVAQYEKKTRRIAPGIIEANKILKQII